MFDFTPFLPLALLAGAVLIFLLGYLSGRGRRYLPGLEVEIKKSYRKRGNTRKFSGWRWQARYKGAASGWGTRPRKNPEECAAYVRQALRVHPKRISIIEID